MSGIYTQLFGLKHQGSGDDEGGPMDFVETGTLTPREREAVWKDLEVLKTDNAEGGLSSREFLTAMKVATSSKLRGKTANEAGIDKLPDIFLVSLERPVDVLGVALVLPHLKR